MRVKPETCERSTVRHPRRPARQMPVLADTQTPAPMPPRAMTPAVPHHASGDRRDGRRVSPGTEGSDPHTATLTTRVPAMLTPDEVARLLRTSKKAVYALVERHQLPGVVRLGRRVLVREDALVNWLRQKSTPSLEGG
jgi:excisionase family DNA binding protein